MGRKLVGETVCTHTYIHIQLQTHIHTIMHTARRLSPEFNDNIIRLPIPISSVVLMMIGVLPMHPSPHGSFVVCWWMGSGGWVVWLISCLDEVKWSYMYVW